MSKRKLQAIVYSTHSIEEVRGKMVNAFMTGRMSFQVGRYNLQLSKERLRTHFLKGFKCECCKLEADHYQVRRNQREVEKSIHLDLFAGNVMFHSLSVDERGDLLCTTCLNERRRDKCKLSI